MMNIRNEDGAITIYLTIIFLVVLALVGALVDGSRIRVAETQVSRVVESAAMSALAGYYNPLKEDYGLFALSHTDKDILLEEIESYLNKNLMTELGQQSKESNQVAYEYLKGLIFNDEFKEVHFMNLFDYRLEDTNVEQLFSLTENEVMRKQITEFMKYRGPIEIYGVANNKIHNIQEKINAIKNIGKTADILSKKINLDELGWKLGALQGELQKNIRYVNVFPRYYHDNKSEYDYLKHSSFNDALYYYSREGYYYIEALNEKDIDDETNGQSYRQVDRRYLDSAFDELNDIIIENKRLNEDIIIKLSEISRFITRIEQEISLCESAIKVEETNTDKHNKGFYDTFKNDINMYKSVISYDVNQSQDLLKKIQQNADFLEDLIIEIKEINRGIDSYDYGSDFEDDVNKATTDLPGYYNDIEYKLYEYKINATNPEGLTDDRDIVNTDLRSFIENTGKSKVLNKETKEKLPSYKDAKGEYPNKITTNPSLIQYDNNVNDFWNITSGYDMGRSGRYSEKDMESTTNIFKVMTNIGSLMENGSMSLRDELFVNEYIIGMLTNNVPMLYKINSTNLNGPRIPYVDTKKDLMNKTKVTDRTAYFENSEAEYIIWGLDTESKNINSTKTTLLTLRLTSNLIAIHGIESKINAANLIAEGIASGLAAFTGGSSVASIPAIRETILAGWAMAEAIEDVNHTLTGGSIPLYKDSYTWITPKIGTIAKQKGEDDKLALSYHDYLRIMLLTTSSDKKMNRLQDLIQLNLSIEKDPDFMIKDYFTNLKINVDVSMRYLFMTQSFMPKSKNTEDGKYKIRSIIYQGY